METISRILNFKYLLLFLAFTFFVSRFINLGILPIFNDESTYIRYGFHQIKEPQGQFYSLNIGKEPLMPYLFAQSGSISGNFLLGARFVSIIFGFITFLGIYLSSRFLLGRYSSILASLFYIFCPYTLFFDRLALMESAVSAVCIWSLYFTVKYSKTFEKINLVWLGLVTGIGTWIKTPAFFYVFLPGIVGTFEYFKSNQKNKKELYLLGSSVIALIIFLPLYLNPLYKNHMKLLGQYSYPLISLSFQVWFYNLEKSIEWMFFFMTPGLFLLSISGIFYSVKNKKNSAVILWILLPFLYEVLYSKNFNPRHTLLLAIPLIVLSTYSTMIFLKKHFKISLVFLFLVFSMFIYSDFFIWLNPLGLGKNYEEYIKGFSSGYGVSDAVKYLEDKKNKKPINIVIRNDHGNPEDAIALYFSYKEDVGLSIFDKPYERLKAVKDQTPYPVYFVSRGPQYGGLEKYFKSSKIFKKPLDSEFVGVYEVDLKKL